jgi:hypothetical protein
VEPSPAPTGAPDRWAPGTQAIASLLEQRVASRRRRNRYRCWFGGGRGLERGRSLGGILDRDRHRRGDLFSGSLVWRVDSSLRHLRLFDGPRVVALNLARGVHLRRLDRLCRGSLLRLLGHKPRAAARALFPVSLAFLLGAFAGRL